MCPSFDPNAHKETPLGISALTPPSRPEDVVETILEFPDNRLLIGLCGEFDRNLAQIEHQMGVHVLRRGNRLSVIGDKGAREQAAAVLRSLYARLESGRGVVAGDTTALLAGLDSARDQSNNIVISCRFLVRVDFSAAGTILNWVVSRQAEGCMVQFQDVHRLVAAFFNVIGISEHARVVPRDL